MCCVWQEDQLGMVQTLLITELIWYLNFYNLLSKTKSLIQSVISSAEQYFKSSVLKENPDISNGIGMPDLKLVGALAACWVLLFLTLWKGVASSGKVQSNFESFN